MGSSIVRSAAAAAASPFLSQLSRLYTFSGCSRLPHSPGDGTTKSAPTTTQPMKPFNDFSDLHGALHLVTADPTTNPMSADYKSPNSQLQVFHCSTAPASYESPDSYESPTSQVLANLAQALHHPAMT